MISAISPKVYKLCNGSSQLHRYLKKHFVSDLSKFGKIVDGLPDSKVVVGTLPPEWIEGVDKTGLRKLTKQAGVLCSKFSAMVAQIEREVAEKYMRSEEFATFNPAFEDRVKILKDVVTKVLSSDATERSAGLSCIEAFKGKFDSAIKTFQGVLSRLLKKGVTVEELGKGSYGRTFVIDVGGKKTVLKTFTDEVSDDKFGVHGRVAEIVKAPFVKRHTGDNQFARFFLGKLSKHDVADDGFMLLRFIESNPNKSNGCSMYPSVFRHVYSSDSESIGNRISSTVVDYGGLAINKELFSKEKIKLIRQIEKAFVSGDLKLFNSIMEKNRDSKALQEVLTFIKEKLNKEIMESGCFYTKPEQMRMYEVFGVKLHPEEKMYMTAEEVALCEKHNLFDESQTMRMISNDFFEI